MFENKKVFLEIGEERFEIHNALIGASMKPNGEEPFSIYAGKLDVSDIGLALLHVIRAAMKITREEYNTPLSVTKEFIEFTVKTAFDMESTNDFMDFVRSDSVQEFILKKKM